MAFISTLAIPRTAQSLSSNQGNGFAVQPESAQDLAIAGLVCFDDFWRLPEEYVDEVNVRRGGWSAVSRLKLLSPDGIVIYYVKRQMNQLRRSLRHPIGVLTYHYELAAIQRNRRLGLPGVTVAGFGFHSAANCHRGILITRALTSKPLSELSESKPCWNTLTPLLQRAGYLLYRMHANRISHGALYPKHLYLDLAPTPNKLSDQVHLIDFERSRRCLTASMAIRRDLTQFLKRAQDLPESALEALLNSHLRFYPKLTNQLLERYYAC